mgnify:CR=1 FL=1
MKKKILLQYIMSFTVFLHSNNGEKETAGQTNSMFYNFDWNSTRPTDYIGEYEVTFSFVSFGTVAQTDDVFFITADFGGTADAYAPNLTNGAVQSRVLGFVRQSTINTPASPNNGQFSADVTQNVPVRIATKPSQNQFNVRLLDGDGNLFLLGTNVAYVLSIHFRTITSIGCMD